MPVLEFELTASGIRMPISRYDSFGLLLSENPNTGALIRFWLNRVMINNGPELESNPVAMPTIPSIASMPVCEVTANHLKFTMQVRAEEVTQTVSVA